MERPLKRRRRDGAVWAAILSAGLMCAGCVPAPSPINGAIDGNVGIDPAQYPGEKVQGEPNGTFDQAITVILDDAGQGHLAGTVATASDVDVYAFTTLQAGDRVILDVAAQTRGTSLDADIALFDETGRLIFENDDRTINPPQLDPFANQVLRRAGRIYFLAMYRSPLAAPPDFGSYEVLVTSVPGGQVPPGQGQTVVLDFDGGTITLLDGTVTVGPFDAADISPAYAGLTAAVRGRIRTTILDRYDGLSLNALSVPGDALPSGSYSTVLFGGTSPDAFGEAQAVDTYNANPRDGGIVYTGMFTPSRFGVLTADELGTAIGNIAAHEVGHLLGLNHVINVHDFMDTSGDSLSLLGRMVPQNSLLDPQVAPLGTQDDFLLLLETLGASQ